MLSGTDTDFDAQIMGFVEQILERESHLDLEVARLLDVARYRHELESGATVHSVLHPPVRALPGDRCGMGESLDVVHEGGQSVQALLSRERRLVTGLPAPVLFLSRRLANDHPVGLAAEEGEEALF